MSHRSKSFCRTALWLPCGTRTFFRRISLAILLGACADLHADDLAAPPESPPAAQDVLADLPEVKVAIDEVRTIFTEAQEALNSYTTKGRIKSSASLLTLRGLDVDDLDKVQRQEWNKAALRFGSQSHFYVELYTESQSAVDSFSACVIGLCVPQSPESSAKVFGYPDTTPGKVKEKKSEWISEQFRDFDKVTYRGESHLKRLGATLSDAERVDKSAPDSHSYSDWLNSYSKQDGHGPSAKGSAFTAQSAIIRKVIAKKLDADYDKARVEYFQSEAESRRDSIVRAKARAEDERKARLEADMIRAKELQSLDSNEKKAQYLVELCTWRNELPDFVVQNSTPLRKEIVALLCREIKPNLRDDKIGVTNIPAERSRLLELCAFGIADPPLKQGTGEPRSEAPDPQALEAIKKCLASPETQFGARNVLAHLSLLSEQIVHWTRGNSNLASSEQDVACWNAALKTVTRKHLLRIYDHFTVMRAELLAQRIEAAKPQIQWDLAILAQLEDFKSDGILDMRTVAIQTKNFHQAAGVFTWGIDCYLSLLQDIAPKPPVPPKSDEQLRTEELWENAIAGIDLSGESFQFFRKQIETAEFHIIRLQQQLGPDPVYEFKTRTFGGEFGVMMAVSAIQGGIMARDLAIQRDIDAMIDHYNTSVQLLLYQRDALAYQKLPANQQKLVDKYDLRTKAFPEPAKTAFDPAKLVGQWQYNLLVYSFSADGKVTQGVGGLPSEPPLPKSCRIDGDRLTMKIRSGFDVTTINWTVKSITDDELVITEDGLAGTLTLKRLK
jgi:hypothetical protein